MANREEMKRKAEFNKLREDPEYYFGNGVELILFPNGEKGEIWIRAKNGNVIAITAGASEYGTGVTIRKGVGGQPLTVTGNLADMRPAGSTDFYEVGVTIYNWGILAARQFKLWYGQLRRQIPHPNEKQLTVDQIERLEAGDPVDSVLKDTP